MEAASVSSADDRDIVFLNGDVVRYRHPAPTCSAFGAARPTLPRTRGRRDDARIKGNSYPQAWYEDAVGAILGEIGRVDDATISEVVHLHGAQSATRRRAQPGPDRPRP